MFLLYTITSMCVEEKTSDSRNKKSTFILSILYATIKSISRISFSREFSWVYRKRSDQNIEPSFK